MYDINKPYLTDSIKREMDKIGAETIEEMGCGNRLILKAPVGAGKNYFCMHELPKMAKKSKRPPQEQNILFITSRTATVEQIGRELANIAEQEGFSPSVTFGRIGEAIEGKNYIYGHSWDVEKHLAEYIELARKGYFSYIVMDECHSLITDSTFAAAPLAVLEFLEAVSPDTTVILMSACPERVFHSELANEYRLLEFDCHKVEPRNVAIIPGTTTAAIINKANEDNKILYFVTDTKHAYQKEKELLEKGIRAAAITSQPNKRKEVYKSNSEIDEREKMSGLVLKSLREREIFFDNIDIIIATTKLREGINIKDSRVKTVISELRDSVSLIQCAGRVRQGVENFYIVDGTRHALVTEYRERYSNAKKLLPSYNDTLPNFDSPAEKQKYIANTEKLHPGIVFYSEYKNCFVLNRYYIMEQETKWKDYDEWKTDRAAYVRRVMEREQVTYEVEDSALLEIIEPYCGRRITAQEKNEFLTKLNAVLPPQKQVSRKINTILNRLGYDCKMRSDKRTYDILKISENHTDI